MDRFEVEWLAMEFWSRGRGIALKFPREHSGETFIVAQRFAFRGLMFFTEMRAAGFVTSECVETHQLGEFQKVGHPSGALERLIKIFAVTGHSDPAVAGPECYAQLWNFSQRFFEAGFISRHSAFAPKKRAELSVHRVE